MSDASELSGIFHDAVSHTVGNRGGSAISELPDADQDPPEVEEEEGTDIPKVIQPGRPGASGVDFTQTMAHIMRSLSSFLPLPVQRIAYLIGDFTDSGSLLYTALEARERWPKMKIRELESSRLRARMQPIKGYTPDECLPAIMHVVDGNALCEIESLSESDEREEGKGSIFNLQWCSNKGMSSRLGSSFTMGWDISAVSDVTDSTTPLRVSGTKDELLKQSARTQLWWTITENRHLLKPRKVVKAENDRDKEVQEEEEEELPPFIRALEICLSQATRRRHVQVLYEPENWSMEMSIEEDDDADEGQGGGMSTDWKSKLVIHRWSRRG